MKYEKLSKIFYKEGEEYTNNEYEKRKNSYGAYQTPLTIQGFRKGKLTRDFQTLFYVNTPKLLHLNNRVLLNSSKISSLKAKLPQYIEETYYQKLIVNEVQSNNEIEGIRSTENDLWEVLGEVKQTTPNHKRFTGMMETYLFIDDIKPLRNVLDFRKLYDDLVYGEVDNEDDPDGEMFREGYVEVNNGTTTTHIGVSTEKEIIVSLNLLINYLRDEEHPELYRYMVAHYFYEYIHPFYDGNGRTGRIIVSRYLSKYLERYSAVTFSYAINKNKSKYYKALEEIPHPLNRGEVTFYLMDMLEILASGQEDIIEDLEVSLAKLNRIEDKFRGEDWEDQHEEILLLKFLLGLSVFINEEDGIVISKIIEATNQSRYIVNKVMDRLESEGYVEKVGQRPKSYKVKEEFLENMIGI